MPIIRSHILFSVAILIYFPGVVWGQHNYRLEISPENRKELGISHLDDIFRELVKQPGDLSEFMYLIYDQGFLEAGYTTIEPDSNATVVRIYPGEKYEWASIHQGNLPDEILYRTGIRKSLFKEKIVNFTRLTRLFHDIVQYAGNHGYPFAAVSLKKISVNGNSISAEINYQPGPFITFGRIELINHNSVDPDFLSVYLNIPASSVYAQRKIDKLSYLINQLPYLTLNKDPELHFANQQCEVLLDADEAKASSFDGFIGLLPNEGAGNKFLITGQINLKLENLFKSGKALEFDWQKPNTLMQELSTGYTHPALLKLPLDADFKFSLLKQDTTYLTRNVAVELRYNKSGFGGIGFNFNLTSSRLLNTGYIQSADDLDAIDYNLYNYGFSYIFNTISNTYFPERGLKIQAEIKAGNKRILRNSGIDEKYYQDIKTQSTQAQIKLSIEKYFPIKSFQVLYTGLFSGYLHNDQLFLNDLFRLGGLKTIRGFNEKAFYASEYFIGRIEYRYSFETRSQLFVFVDGAGLSYRLPESEYTDFPIATGFGFDISTRAGVLTLVYALGKSREQSFGLEYSRIHIGYSNRF